jgi:4-amino-4-deoxy-L-arabinose transferase-like glycosyltransferase
MEIPVGTMATLLKHPRRIPNLLFWMVFAALALRLVVVVCLYQNCLDPRRDHWPFGYETGRIARSVASGQGFSDPLFGHTGPSAWVAPVYPYLLAGIFKLFGIFTKPAALAILSLNSLFSALTCLPIFFAARKCFGPPTDTWAGWIWAVFPYAVYLSADSVWETCLTTLLLSLLFLITLHLEHSSRLAAWVGYGLLWGLTALTNPAVLSVLPLLGGWASYRLHRHGDSWCRPAGAAALAFLFTVTPWSVRNYVAFRQPVFIKDNFWLEVRVGNAGNALHWWNEDVHPSHSDGEMEELRRLGEVAYMANKRHQALALIANHPGFFAWRTLRRLVYLWTGFWSFRAEYLQGEPFDPANVVLRTTLTVLALLGLRQAFRNAQGPVFPYVLVLFSFPLVYFVTHPDICYRHPIDPEITILAVYGAICCLSWYRFAIRLQAIAKPHGSD